MLYMSMLLSMLVCRVFVVYGVTGVAVVVVVLWLVLRLVVLLVLTLLLPMVLLSHVSLAFGVALLVVGGVYVVNGGVCGGGVGYVYDGSVCVLCWYVCC